MGRFQPPLPLQQTSQYQQSTEVLTRLREHFEGPSKADDSDLFRAKNSGTWCLLSDTSIRNMWESLGLSGKTREDG